MTSPATISGLYWRDNITTYACNNQTEVGGYVQFWRYWQRSTGGVDFSQSHSDVVDNLDYTNRLTFEAHFERGFKATFVNSFGAGSIIVNNQSRSSGWIEIVPPTTPPTAVSAQACYQSYNYLVYSFSHWTNNKDGNTVYSASTNFSPYDNTTYTANFNVTKPTAPPNVSAGGTVGQSVQVAWSEHPCQSVTQYQVWRRVKPPGGELQPPELKATLNRGTTSWTDPDYVVTAGYTDAIVNYDVKSYYSPNQTYSDPEWVGIFARFEKGMRDDATPQLGTEAGQLEYAVGTYPNPFNPSTTIAYQVAKDASVKLEIYDVMGRKVRTLLDESKSAGYFSVIWNGRDDMGKDVASGLYLYRFVAVPASGEKAFKQSGKLLLTR